MEPVEGVEHDFRITVSMCWSVKSISRSSCNDSRCDTFLDEVTPPQSIAVLDTTFSRRLLPPRRDN